MPPDKRQVQEVQEVQAARQALKDILDGNVARHTYAQSSLGPLTIIVFEKYADDPMCEFVERLLKNRLQSVRNRGVDRIDERNAKDIEAFMGGEMKGYMIHEDDDHVTFYIHQSLCEPLKNPSQKSR